MHIVAFGGSLRAASRNRALLEEAAALMPSGTDLDLGSLALVGALPLYSQDIEDNSFARWSPASPPTASSCRAPASPDRISRALAPAPR